MNLRWMLTVEHQYLFPFANTESSSEASFLSSYPYVQLTGGIFELFGDL